MSLYAYQDAELLNYHIQCNYNRRRLFTAYEKIEKAQAAVLAAKNKYDAALDELEKLVTKRKQLEDKKLLEAYHAGDKTADEIIEFIRSGAQKKE